MISHFVTQTAQRLFFRSGTITNTSPITPRMRQIRKSDPSLRDLPWSRGQHIRVLIEGPRPQLRTFTVREYDRQAGSIALWILLHGEGPGS